jgi:hypothetical protein
MPFSTKLDRWKSNEVLGTLIGPEDAAVRGVQSGRLADLVEASPGGQGSLVLSMWTARDGGAADDIDLSLQRARDDGKGNIVMDDVVMASWPAEAIQPLRDLFTQPQVQSTTQDETSNQVGNPPEGSGQA